MTGSRNFRRAAAFRGGNPRNVKASVGRPDTLSAATAADGPGTRTEPVVDLLDEDLDLPDDVAGEYDDLLTFGGS
ncbi:MAG: hypothetical protein ACLFPR_18010 [Desulfococcaceae bacterium]